MSKTELDEIGQKKEMIGSKNGTKLVDRRRKEGRTSAKRH